MKKILFCSCFVAILFSCNNDRNECNTFATYSDINVCLPDLEEMTECYNESKYRNLVHTLSPSSNLTLAYYMNDRTYLANRERYSISSSVDDYFWVYATNELMEINCTKQSLNYMAQIYLEDFGMGLFQFLNILAGYNSNEVVRYVEESTGLSEDGTVLLESSTNIINNHLPVLLESYAINSNIRSFSHLIKINRNGDSFYKIYTVNLLLIKNRIIWAAYYKDYKEKSTLEETRTKNDHLVLKLFEKNN
jgi:hypothetical protein